jgi:peptidoglycan/LPS O-acetylase OafA/YrhL
MPSAQGCHVSDLPLAKAPTEARVRVEALDLLRLIAALSVVVFHYAFRGAAADGYTMVHVPEWAAVARYGYLGVDLFFIISGFVIAWSAAGRTAVSFGIARAARIYPGFLVCMSLTFLFCMSLGGPRFAVTEQQWLANLFIVAPALRQPFMDGVYWSIVYELVFYGWVAVLLGCGIFWRKFDLIVVVWLVLSLGNEHLLHSGALERIFLTSKSGFFAVGMMLYALRSGRGGIGVLLLLLGSLVAAVDQAVLDANWLRQHYQQTWSDLTIALATVACAGAVALATWIKRVPLPAGVTLALGGLTYPLYLLHQHIGYVALNALNGAASPAVLVFGTAATMVGISWLVWRFIERPGVRVFKGALTALAVPVQEGVEQVRTAILSGLRPLRWRTAAYVTSALALGVLVGRFALPPSKVEPPTKTAASQQSPAR